MNLKFYVQHDHRYVGSVIFAFKTTLTTTLNHITCINTFGQGFKKDAIHYQCSLYYPCVKIALIVNRVFSKTYLGSIYTSFMIEGSGQQNQLTPSICEHDQTPRLQNRFSLVKKSRWPPVLIIAKPIKIAVFSRMARYIWLKLCMEC